jgi:perosamine synthetase
MAVSRGTVQHSIREDFWNTLLSQIAPRSTTKRATLKQKEAVSQKVEKKLGIKNITLCPYARSAFHAILTSLNLPPNSEILLTPISIGPMLEIIKSLGHKPIFVDIELETFCADTQELENKLKTKPPCFLLTYLFGYVPNIEKIAKMCEESGTVLIEDISHNICATFNGRPLGTFGTAAIYSASLLKYLDAYNGAFATTNNLSLHHSLNKKVSEYNEPNSKRIKRIIKTTLIWNISLSKIPFSLIVYPLLSLIKKINREKFEAILGAKIKFDLSEKLPPYYFEDISWIQCNMMFKQLTKLDKIINPRIERVSRFSLIGEKILGSPLIPNDNKSKSSKKHTFWQLVAPVNNLKEARDKLFAEGFETGSTNLYDLASFSGIKLKNSQKLKNQYIFIPIHENLSPQKQKLFLKCIRNNEEIICK